MRIPRYWTRVTVPCPRELLELNSRVLRNRFGNGEFLKVRGWSDVSQEEARKNAEERALRVFQALQHDKGGTDSYAYGDRPLAEAQVAATELSVSPDEAIVTRNRYGALILNTARLFIADIDNHIAGHSSKGSPQGKSRSNPTHYRQPSVEKSSRWSPWNLFGGGKIKAGMPESHEMIKNRVESVARTHGFSYRVYQTAGGYRVLITSALFHPKDAQTREIFNELGADEKYIRLTTLQDCFRARLTPKPWRMNMAMPRVGFPFLTDQEQRSIADWIERYSQACKRYTTANLIMVSTKCGELQQLQPIIQYHDDKVRIKIDLPLA